MRSFQEKFPHCGRTVVRSGSLLADSPVPCGLAVTCWLSYCLASLLAGAGTAVLAELEGGAVEGITGEGSGYHVNMPETWRSRALCHML